MQMCKCGKSMMKGESCKDCGYGVNVKKGDETSSEHGEREVSMSMSQLHRICDMADMLKKVAGKEKKIPAWVQSHLAVAHENLSQVFGYMEPKHHGETKKAMPGATAPGATAPMRVAPAAPKAPTMGAAKSEVNEEETSVRKSVSSIPTFPRVSGGSDRVLLQHLSPDQGVISTITNRDTFAPIAVPLKPSDPTKP